MSFATFFATTLLTARVIAGGPMVWLEEQFIVDPSNALLVPLAGLLKEQFFVDPFNVFLVALTAFVGFTTALFSRPYMRTEQDHGRVNAARLRLYHSMYQLFTFTMLLCLLSNNVGVMWVAMEGATLSTVLLVSLYRTPASLEAAWKYFILCSVGLAQALFGTILLYFAAEKVLGPGGTALLWTHLHQVRGQLEPTVLSLAFVFLLVGYGTKVGLVPLHNWLPDAHAEGPTPISAVLSGLLLNVALYALIRFKVLTDGALLAVSGEGARFASRLMMGFGLLSVVVAACFLSRQKDIKRMFAYSSIEHMGLITFAFGMGGPVASFAGLLHMTLHSLTKSAIFFAVGHISQAKGTQRIAEIRGLTESHPVLGWGLVVGVAAIAGLPPLGIFMSEFLIVSSTFARAPLLAILVVFGLLIAFGALMLRLSEVAFGEPTGSNAPVEASYVPLFAHLGLVLAAGIYLPGPLVAWFQAVARLLG